MMQKNEIVKVKIEDIGVGGEGIGKVEDTRCLSKMPSSGML